MRDSLAIVLFLLGAAFGRAPAQQDDDGPMTNLGMFRHLASRIGHSVAAELNTQDSLVAAFTVLPRETGWLLEDSLLAPLARRGLRVSSAVSAPGAAELGISDMRVEYSNIRQRGFFGPTVVDRLVVVRVRAKIVNQQTGALLVSGEFSANHEDVIDVDDVGRLENASIPATRGVLPAEGFFSTFAEPLLVLGAIGVAVFLLFSIRS